jgi:hypothetical protein
MSSRETRLIALFMLLAAPIALWPSRSALRWHALESVAIVAGFAFAGAGLVVGAIVAWNRLKGLISRPGGGPGPSA